MKEIRSRLDDAQLIDVMARQQERWQRIDGRLPQIPVAMLSAFLRSIYDSCQRRPVVISEGSQLMCMAFAGLRRIDRESDELVYFEELSGTAIQLSFRSTSKRTLDRSFGSLLARLHSNWMADGADAGVIYWPTSDVDVSRRFQEAGYALDSYVALRSGADSIQDSGKLSSPIVIRPARCEDEDSILSIHRQVIEAHIPSAPFARFHPAAMPEIRRRLRENWARRPTGKEEAIVLVAEFKNGVVGVAECRVVSVRHEPGMMFNPGRYIVVDTFGIAREYRRKGIGHALESAVSRVCQERSLDGSYLIFSPYNASANAFWPKVGYRPLWTLYQRRGLR